MLTLTFYQLLSTNLVRLRRISKNTNAIELKHKMTIDNTISIYIIYGPGTSHHSAQLMPIQRIEKMTN